MHVRSVIHGADQECEYELRATTGWVFRALTARVDSQVLEVTRSDRGWAVDGEPRADLEEAVDVDISVSPLSNTLPIRRLGLALGESADIVTAYVTLPDLAVSADPQRYTRVGERAYLYQSRDSDFERTITVDDDGLVIDYPGLFEREDPPG
ncbi:hypothetical protein GCM10010921_21470 [Microbacterium album]|uniref:Glycolipid-binding domain-containing protein n=1 Tax=Microbacterium album TaxID=2053191 RepID=A0A917IHA8_9MICO|nr:hypothetical protein GCM10010921_21470 [Microbacterium album]